MITDKGDLFMRKILIGLLVIVCIGIGIHSLNKEEEIRVRIIPNSDTKKDLDIKEKAKDITVCYLKEAYSKNYDEYLSNLKYSANAFEDILEKELKQNVKIELGNHTLYNKTYNNNAIKNTSEMTLYIILGEGKGSNWWGTIYPEFLEVSSSEEIRYESLILSIFNKIKGE